MNFGQVELDEATRLLWAEVRAFLDERIEEVQEQEWRTGDGVNVELQMALGERGWITPMLPKEAGGIDATALQAVVITRELVHHRVPLNSHSNTMQVLAALKEYGSDELLAELVPAVAAGSMRFCLGYTEPDAGSDLAAVKTRARRDGDEWVISGQKMFTTTAHHAHYCFVLARTNPSAPKHKGLTTFLVPLRQGNVEITAIHTLGGERTNMVFFDDVRVPDKYRLGPVDEGWAVLSNPLNIEHGIDDSGLPPIETDGGLNFSRMLARALEAAVGWATTAGPDGRRPADDVLVRGRLAQVALDVELSRLPSGPVGRVISSELLIRDAADLLDLVGAAGVLPRREPGAIADGYIEYVHRFAQGTAIYAGTTDIHRGIIAERFLGLPRARTA